MEFTRDLPYSAEAETAVLGSILIDNKCINVIMAMLKPESFFLEKNKAIYGCMSDLYNSDTPVDVITVADELKKQGLIEQIGSIEYLYEVIKSVPSALNAENYAKIVVDMAQRRSLIDTCKKIEEDCYDSKDATAITEYAVQAIFDTVSQNEANGVTHIKKILNQSLNKFSQMIEERKNGENSVSGIPTGFLELDKRLSGLQPSTLVLIAARPAMGKTSFAINIAQNVAIKYNKPVLIFSLEMSKEELVNRIISSEAKVESEKIRSGEITEEDFDKILDASPCLEKAPIFIDDTASITITELRAKAKRLKLEHDLGLIVIDYLQLMNGRKSESRQVEIAEISRSLKILAKELQVPVIAVSQLSRSAENRADNKPMLSDLRESGAIEQDADIVMFLYREEYYKKETTEKHNIGECIIAKHRAGETGNFDMTWLGKFTSFYNLETNHDV